LHPTEARITKTDVKKTLKNCLAFFIFLDFK